MTISPEPPAQQLHKLQQPEGTRVHVPTMALLASESSVRSMTIGVGAPWIWMVSPDLTLGGTVTIIVPPGVLTWDGSPSLTPGGTATLN